MPRHAHLCHKHPNVRVAKNWCGCCSWILWVEFVRLNVGIHIVFVKSLKFDEKWQWGSCQFLWISAWATCALAWFLWSIKWRMKQNLSYLFLNLVAPIGAVLKGRVTALFSSCRRQVTLMLMTGKFGSYVAVYTGRKRSCVVPAQVATQPSNKPPVCNWPDKSMKRKRSIDVNTNNLTRANLGICFLCRSFYLLVSKNTYSTHLFIQSLIPRCDDDRPMPFLSFRSGATINSTDLLEWWG